MNRSSRKAHEATASGFRRARAATAACICRRWSAGRPVRFSYSSHRMGFWYGQRPLRLIGHGRTQAKYSPLRKSQRHA